MHHARGAHQLARTKQPHCITRGVRTSLLAQSSRTASRAGCAPACSHKAAALHHGNLQSHCLQTHLICVSTSLPKKMSSCPLPFLQCLLTASFLTRTHPCMHIHHPYAAQITHPICLPLLTHMTTHLTWPRVNWSGSCASNINAHVHTHAHARTHTCTCIHTNTHVHTQTCTLKQVYTHTRTCKRVHTHKRARIHTNTQAYAHRCKTTPMPSRPPCALLRSYAKTIFASPSCNGSSGLPRLARRQS